MNNGGAIKEMDFIAYGEEEAYKKRPPKIKFFTDRNTDLLASSTVPFATVTPKKQFSMEESCFHQCEQCGKIYKHRNCLSKHRWEHHESWELTKKACQTKHQQVQMLEAAQVLLEMKIGSPKSLQQQVLSSLQKSSEQSPDRLENQENLQTTLVQ
jgi:hypothetical protein